MKILTLDFETYWSKTHSLSKMSPIEYVMHPETEIISCAVKLDHYPTDVIFGEKEIARVLRKIDGSDKMALAHNMSMFDCMLLAWRLDWRPRLWACTLAMARPLHGRTPVGLGLGKLVAHYGIGVKNNAALMQTQGKHLCDFTAAEIEQMRIYNKDDTEQCYALFKHLRQHTSAREMWTIDSNIRMLVDEQFELDMPLLHTALRRERAKKRRTLLALSTRLDISAPVVAGESEEPWTEDDLATAVKGELMSAAKFSKLLESLGVDVPTKPSPKDPDKEIPALAKDDPEFQELLEHDNDLVAAAAAARLEMKSTLLESRLQALIATGTARDGKLPVPARYYGAHTGRDSGELYNMLNLPRISWNKDGKMEPKLTNALRLAPRAPKGKVVIVADLSGIEMRINHTLWKVPYSMAMWKEDPVADIYKATAARYYKIDEAEVSKDQRQFGKVLQLMCGFQVGPPKFRTTARKFGLNLTPEVSQEGVYGWRNLHPEIAERDHGGWARCQEALRYIQAGQEWAIDPWGLAVTCKEGIRLTCDNDRLIRYPDLRVEVNEKTGREEWKYGQGRHTRYIYGGKEDENIVQALGRTILMDNVMEFFKRADLRPALRVYDEAAYVVEEQHAESLLAELLYVMRTPPKWWPELVVWSEGESAVSYGLAK